MTALPEKVPVNGCDVRRLREDCGLSQYGAAHLAMAQRSTWQKWELPGCESGMPQFRWDLFVAGVRGWRPSKTLTATTIHPKVKARLAHAELQYGSSVDVLFKQWASDGMSVWSVAELLDYGCATSNAVALARAASLFGVKLAKRRRDALPATNHQRGVDAHNARKITFNGETKTLSQWAKHVGIGAPALSERLTKLPLEEALRVGKRINVEAAHAARRARHATDGLGAHRNGLAGVRGRVRPDVVGAQSTQVS